QHADDYFRQSNSDRLLEPPLKSVICRVWIASTVISQPPATALGPHMHQRHLATIPRGYESISNRLESLDSMGKSLANSGVPEFLKISPQARSATGPMIPGCG